MSLRPMCNPTGCIVSLTWLTVSCAVNCWLHSAMNNSAQIIAPPRSSPRPSARVSPSTTQRHCKSCLFPAFLTPSHPFPPSSGGSTIHLRPPSAVRTSPTTYPSGLAPKPFEPLPSTSLDQRNAFLCISLFFPVSYSLLYCILLSSLIVPAAVPTALIHLAFIAGLCLLLLTASTSLPPPTSKSSSLHQHHQWLPKPQVLLPRTRKTWDPNSWP